jgi:hypothetical protein
MIKIALAATLASIGIASAVASPAQASSTPTGNLSGSVRDTTGAVLASAQISVYADPAGDPVARATTDAAGQWRIAGVETGQYKVSIGLGGWSEWAPGQRDSSTAVEYQVRKNRTTNVGSVVTAAGVVHGKLTRADGQAAAAVRVTASDYASANSWQTTTSSTGLYSLRVRPGAEYVISFADGNFVQYSPGTTDQQQARSYTVGSGQQLRVDDQLLSAPSLTGRLTDAAGAPIAGANVRFLTDTANEFSTTTDADGRYRFDKLSEWTIKVEFRTADVEPRVQWAYQKLNYNEATEFTLKTGTETIVDDTLLP